MVDVDGPEPPINNLLVDGVEVPPGDFHASAGDSESKPNLDILVDVDHVVMPGYGHRLAHTANAWTSL